MWTLLPVLGLMALFFVWGFFVARARGRSGFVWGIACGLTAFIGIAILYSLGDNAPAPARDRRTALADTAPSAEAAAMRLDVPAPANKSRPGSEIVTGETSEDRRWRYLCDYHPEVRKAVAAVGLMGEDALYELKAAHLAVNDASVLPDIVQRLGERFGRAAAPAKLNGAANGQVRSAVSPPPELVEDDDEEPLMLEPPPPAKTQPRRVAQDTKDTRAAAIAPGAGRPAGLDLQADHSLPPKDIPGADATGGMDDDALIGAAGESQVPASDFKSAETRPATLTQAAKSADQRPPVSDRTNVTPTDLQGARFLETYAGVHLFGLNDGRVFIDRHEARGSLDLARSFVDQVTSRRING